MSLTHIGPQVGRHDHRRPSPSLVERYEADWRSSPGSRPDPAEYLPDDPVQRPAALLALLRADLALRWRMQERRPIEWYRDRYPELDGESLVALLYEEYCLREEAGESPEAAEYQARFPDVADSFQEVLEIHDLVGRARAPASRGPCREWYAVPGGRPDDRRVPAGRGAGPRRIRAGLSRRGAAAGRPARRAEGDANRLARAADPGAAPAHPHRPRLLLPDRPGDRPASALHAVSRPDHAPADPRSSGDPGRPHGRRPRRPAGPPPAARRRPGGACREPVGAGAADLRPGDRLVGRPDGRGAPARPRPRGLAPRRQAVERPGDRRRPADAAGLQPRAGAPGSTTPRPRPPRSAGRSPTWRPSSSRRSPRAGRTRSTPAPISMPWASSSSTAW